MTGPGLWIAVPLFLGLAAFLVSTERTAAWIGGLTCVVLGLLALLLPVDEALLFGPISLKIASTATLLGRSLVVPPAAGPLLALLFGLCAVWFFGSAAAGVARRLVPLGLVVLSLLIAALAVRPFLYAALLTEMAALAAIPLLTTEGHTASRAVIKFLVYQTLGMPCILLAGWLLAGVETSPSDLALTVQATIALTLGFAFLLAIFPLNDWIPGLLQQSHPYLAGFVLWVLPNVILVFGLSFLDGYAWLRSSSEIAAGLRVLGLVMLVSSGLASAVEHNLGRLMGHAVIAETGLVFLAASLVLTTGADTLFPFFIPRGVGLALWALSLSQVHGESPAMDLDALKEVGKSRPWAGAGLALASLSVAGFPLLGGFPPRIDVLDGLAKISSAAAVWGLVGLAGLMVGAVRQVALIVSQRGEAPVVAAESRLQRIAFGIGMTSLIGLGVFPNSVDFLVAKLPLVFEHLAR